MDSISNNLRKIRIAKGLSQSKLSQLSGIGRTTISEIENDRHSNTTIYVLCKFCKVLEITPNDLIPEEMYK